jgi:hypothetical protein
MLCPAVEDGVTLEQSRRGAPSKLTFSVVKEVNGTADSALDFQEGNLVIFEHDGIGLFVGYVFTKSRNKNGLISVTCYDQLRYLKNKDTYAFDGKTASEMLRMIADDYFLNLGTVDDTGYVLPPRIEDNTTLLDMLTSALDDTLTARKKLYVLYDNCSVLNLRDIAALKTDYLLNASSAEDFNYSSSIDKNTYNRVKLTYDNEDTGKREVYIAQDSRNINAWGVLQKYEELKSGGGQAKADALLSLYNRVSHNLSVSSAFGDISVRGGSAVAVRLNLGDTEVSNYMIADKVTHRFKDGIHTMDLNLIGGDFIE